MQTFSRRGITLVEVIVCIGILGLILALLLSGISKIRQQSVMLQSQNHLRQIGLAFQQYCGDREGKMKGLAPSDSQGNVVQGSTVFKQILPWLIPNRESPPENEADLEDWFCPKVPMYRSPGDFTYEIYMSNRPGGNFVKNQTSYTYNMMAFDKGIVVPFKISDGTSQTMAFVEKYFFSDFDNFECGIEWSKTLHRVRRDQRQSFRRPTFADPGWDDVMPKPDGQLNSMASIPGKTFLLRPAYNQTSCSEFQTPYSSGLVVSMFDGSVRVIGANIEEKTFWGLITPSGAEVLGDY
jgi:type II secretory pathway pseudopilin PulG